MTKKDLVNFLAENTGCSKQVADKLIGALPDLIMASLNDSGKCAIPGLGTFAVKTRKARIGRNPKTGETIEIPEKKAVTFKPAGGFAKAFGEDAE